MPIVDPATGTVTGTLVVKPDGSYTFTPAPGYVGPVPTINVYEKRSDGQTLTSSLNIDVTPGACLRHGQAMPHSS